MVKNTGLSLEERAKKLLKYKITRKGEIPNPFTLGFVREVQYLLDHGYTIKMGGTMKYLRYEITLEGRKWAFAK